MEGAVEKKTRGNPFDLIAIGRSPILIVLVPVSGNYVEVTDTLIQRYS